MSKQAQESIKASLEDSKLEARLTLKDLESLQEAFELKGDTLERLKLNREQFVEALSIILNKGTDEEYEELFDKIDICKEGTVSWDQLFQHLMMQLYEKDDKVRNNQVPQWRNPKQLSVPHNDIIIGIDFLRSSHKYVSVSREGTLALTNSDLQASKCVRVGTEACRQRDLWVTGFAVLQNVSKIAIGFTSKEIAFYDISSKSDFSCQYRVQGLEAAPLCLDYWFNPDNANEAVLCWGDVKGKISAILFLSAAINLFERQSGPTEEKQETTLVVGLADIRKGKFRNSNKFITHEAHTDWARQVKYIAGLECFISCATTWENSMVIGWIERRVSLPGAKAAGGQKRKDEIDFRKIMRISTFEVHQGINAFDYHESLNLIATAGANNHICLWNPYVVSKPNGVLTGHVAPVVQVLFNRSKAQVISFSKDKVLRIWDVQLQVCLQRLAGIFPKGQEVSTRFFMHEDTGRLLLSFNSAMTLLAMKAEIRDRVLSHDMPVIGAVLNEKLGQLVSGCQAGCLTFWLLESGQRLRQMPDAHGSAEVTALATDPGADRFYTGATDGFVRVWDWGGHLYHELNCNSISSSAEVSQVLALKQGVVAAGFSKNVTMFKSKSFRERRVEPSEWKEQDVHQDEILSLASCPPHSLITAGYDGVISVWNSSSESCTRQLMQRCSQPPPNLDSEGRSSRSSRRRSAGKGADEAEASFTVTRLRVLDTRKPRARGSANLVSCGANGFVRFWNLHQGALVAEFLAHTQASSIIMEVSPDCQHLVTADGGGFIKVWHIADYCLDSAGQQAADGEEEPLVTERPALESEWQAHSDQINDIRLTERQDRLLIVTASSDCSLSLWDSFGNLIGTFGQEEHWKIEPLSVVLERLERERQVRRTLDAYKSPDFNEKLAGGLPTDAQP
ncbi:hypothetical protein BOX15_Mlig005513g1 [Macrostomum lignano]|uniref:EF-hand domain-containing protein n=1 Tax=Macrostomum lignano TaxID=282301 RepID=A0A267FC31_9PLAT|nr:hypothetical protein BOX15_Mlig005513g1 [Macrostomum lignano]